LISGILLGGLGLGMPLALAFPRRSRLSGHRGMWHLSGSDKERL